jgi:crotonobetainyl-CoA:carnitine CoA-transferase CaiB-like acyl-CoA transferase
MPDPELAHPTSPTDSEGPTAPATGPLTGLTVLDLSTTLPGAFATQFLADAGADVLLVERPGGSPLRRRAAWPALGRGKRSVVLDLATDEGRTELDALLRTADVAVTTFAPRTLDRLGLTADRLSTLNPRLVSAAITGWGTDGPWRDMPGYEGVVLAKLGYFHAKGNTVLRDGPAFVTVPYASWGAAQTAVHGILAALLERETSGLGQHVEADLVRGIAGLDTWTWFVEMVGLRWPGAYESVDPFDRQRRPAGRLVLPLLVARTKDGHWLQFAQVEPRLFQALLDELEVLPLLADPRYRGFPDIAPELLDEVWGHMLEKFGERTRAEWEAVFERRPDLGAESFRAGKEILDHPQLQHDGRVVVVDNPGIGPVRQLAPLAFANGTPLTPVGAAPTLDQHGAEVRGRGPAAPAAGRPDSPAPSGLPLEGVTILELAKMFAGPYGTALLTDLGARVFHIEPLHGDEIRRLSAFPEASAARVMQGKESVSVAVNTEEGKRIVLELARRSDIVLQSFRAGVAARLGLDEASIRELNPDVVYLSAVGYGVGGPYGGRPAYASSIGAAAGLALTDVPDAAGDVRELDETKRTSYRLFSASASQNLQADGASAMGVASTLLMGLLARRRGRTLHDLTTSMLATTANLTTDQTIDYPGRPAGERVDPGLHGLTALYRLYPASGGWVFLAAPSPREWAALLAALPDEAGLRDDRFATPESREAHDADLAGVLADIFVTRPAAAWEKELLPAGVPCVAAGETAPEVLLQSDEAFAGYCTTAVSPIFDEHLRLATPTRFSRSATKADGGCSMGEHTDAVLRELGYSDESIADLRDRGIIGG